MVRQYADGLIRGWAYTRVGLNAGGKKTSLEGVCLYASGSICGWAYTQRFTVANLAAPLVTILTDLLISFLTFYVIFDVKKVGEK